MKVVDDFLEKSYFQVMGMDVQVNSAEIRYSILHGNEQLFASKYKLYLPAEEELRTEIETQKAMFYLQCQENEDKK